MWRFGLIALIAGCGLSVKGKTLPAPVEEPEVSTPAPPPVVVVPDASSPPPPVDAGPDPSAAATLEDFCKKCASCLAADSKFDEGFCDPFKNGATFNVAGCALKGDPPPANVTKGTLNGWSCDDFDDEI